MGRDMTSVKRTDAILEIGKEPVLISNLLRDRCPGSW
jgi:hypothetical protein